MLALSKFAGPSMLIHFFFYIFFIEAVIFLRDSFPSFGVFRSFLPLQLLVLIHELGIFRFEICRFDSNSSQSLS